jgi:hypothetical protein
VLLEIELTIASPILSVWVEFESAIDFLRNVLIVLFALKFDKKKLN